MYLQRQQTNIMGRLLRRNRLHHYVIIIFLQPNKTKIILMSQLRTLFQDKTAWVFFSVSVCTHQINFPGI